MPTYEITSPSGKKLRVTGDKPPSQQELEQIFSQFEVKPERSITDKIAGGAEAALSMATGAVAEPIAGLMGLARTVTAGPEAGAQRVQEFRQNATYQPRTEAGQEYLQNIAEAPILSDIAQSFERGSKFAGQSAMDITGSPAAAAIAEAAPAAIGAYLGAKTPAGAGDRLSSAAQRQAIEADKAVKVADGAINISKPEVPEHVTKAFRTLKADEIKDIADVDPEFYKAMEQVGVTADPLTSYASRNRQFRSIEQALSVMPQSPLKLTEEAFTKDLSSTVTNLMKSYGALDKGEASIKWRNNAMDAIDALADEADVAYEALGKKLDVRQQANPTATLEFISKETDALPLGIADESAPVALKSAFRQLQPRRRVNPETGETEVVPANYASMDTLRKQIGAAAFKKEGEFKDADSALLKRLYSSLTDDLNAMAEAQGLVDDVKQAKAVVAKRKVLEEQAQNILGKNLQKDIEPVLRGSLQALAGQHIQKYKSLMANIPEKEVRQELLMTGLNNLFTSTRKGERNTFLTTDYLKWYNDTMARPAIRKILEADMPEGAAEKFDAIAKIAEGMAKATSDKIPTGVVNSLLDDQAGFLRRLAGGVAAKGARIGLPVGGDITASAITEIANASTKRSAAAGTVLASPEFAYLIRRGVAEGVVTGNKASKALQQAEQKFMKSKKYQAWADTLSSEELQAISSVGLTSFLTSQQQEGNK